MLASSVIRKTQRTKKDGFSVAAIGVEHEAYSSAEEGDNKFVCDFCD